MKCRATNCADRTCECWSVEPPRRRPSTPLPVERRRAFRVWRAWAAPEDGQCPPIALLGSVPDRALVWAARALARDHGVRSAESRGGWDSCGDRGLDAMGLARAWDDARKRPGRRFAEVVRFRATLGGTPRLRSLSDEQARLVLRALSRAPFARTTQSGRRVSGSVLRGRDGEYPRWSHVATIALAALGRLSPAGQWAACQGAVDRAHAEYGPARRLDDDGRCTVVAVRIRHLDWAAVRAVEAEEARIRAMPAAARAKVRAAKWLARNEPPRCPGWILRDVAAACGGVEGHSHVARWLAPSYQVPMRVAAHLALGKRPVDLAPGLTASEAHEWLSDGGGLNPVDWLEKKLVGHTWGLRDVAAVRWLAAVLADPARRAALQRERTLTGPHGEVVRYTYALRVDEIEASDLPEGTRTSVQRAFERAAERFTAAKLAELAVQHERLAPRPEWSSRLPRCARVLDTPAALVAEGEELHHCVGAYAGYIRAQQSVVLALDVCGERSTVELRHGVVAQHRASHNNEPSALSARALKTILARIAKGPKP